MEGRASPRYSKAGSKAGCSEEVSLDSKDVGGSYCHRLGFNSPSVEEHQTTC